MCVCVCCECVCVVSVCVCVLYGILAKDEWVDQWDEHFTCSLHFC